LEHVEKAISLPLLAAFWRLFGYLINHAVKAGADGAFLPESREYVQN
jgi:hypothetical protein